MNPAVYLAGRGGFSWDWSAATSAAVSAAMAARGHMESVFVVDAASVALVNNVTGERLEGKFSVPSFLAHPSVSPLPWVSLHFPASFPLAGKVNELWLAKDTKETPPEQAGDTWSFMVGGWPAQRHFQDLSAERGVKVGVCLNAAFMAATPMMQRALAPHLARLDAVRAQGGGAAGIHVRSGYADYVTSGQNRHDAPEHRDMNESAAALKVRPSGCFARVVALLSGCRARAHVLTTCGCRASSRTPSCGVSWIC
jgi:hypothetical protein